MNRATGGLMYLRLLSLFCFLSLPHAVLAQQSEIRKPERVPETCRVKKPYQSSLFVPPAPYPAKLENGRFWFGTDRLWTNLPVNGILKGLTESSTSGHPQIFEKMFWWRQGYDADTERQPKLKVRGKRIGSPTAAVEVSPAATATSGE